MDFSSLVLMEKEKDTNIFIRELDSYTVNEGAEYIKKLYYDGEKINVIFDTDKDEDKDLEEWEYSAIFDLFDNGVFAKAGFKLEEIDSEYNPTYKTAFKYDVDHQVVKEKLNTLCLLIDEEMENVFKNIKGKEAEYLE